MTVIVMHDECNGWALKMRVRDWQAAARGQVNKREAHDERKSCSHEVDGLPNGSRLSCGRNGGRRKALEPQRKMLAGEATQFFLHERPAASSAC